MNIDLKRFIVFNTSDGQGEGCEQDKLLFHWTKDVIDNRISLVEQIDDVCMCDASITASSRLGKGISYSGDDRDGHRTSCGSESLTSRVDPLRQCNNGQSVVITFDPTVVVIVEVEPEQSIWIGVHVAPSQSTESNQHQSASSNQDIIPAEAIKQVVRNIYLRFCLLNGTFQMIAKDALGSAKLNDNQSRDVIREELRTICQSYFNIALAEIHLTSLMSNIASLHNYLVYLDLNPLTLMRVISFINHLVSIDPNQIEHTITIFNDQLIWSSLGAVDSRLLYNYLVAVLIRDALQEELVKETDKVRLIAEDMPIYLNDNDCQNSSKSTNIESSMSAARIDDSNRLTKHYMTVFRSSNNLTLGLIFKDFNKTELRRKCEQMLTTDSRVSVIPLTSLAKLVGQNFIKTSAGTLSAIASNTSNSVPNKRRQSISSTGYLKTSLPNDHRYFSIDRLSFSASSLSSVDTQTRDGPQIGHLESANLELLCSRKLRFIKHLLELELEIQDINGQTGGRVEEYFAKTTSDAWLTVLNSKYRCVYSLYKMKNAGLSEARASVINLKSSLVMNRS